MSRTLTTQMGDAAALVVTKPGYLIAIIFKETAWRGSTRGAQTLFTTGESGIITFPERGISIKGLGIDGSQSSQTGSMVINDPDGSLTALILAEGIGDKRVLIVSFYDDISHPDRLTVFDGVGDDADIDPNAGTVTIKLQQQSSQTLFAPRHYMTRETGFSVLVPAGTVVTVGQETYTFEASE